MSRNGRNPKSPAYQWYPSDAAIDENYRLLDDAERGNFHTLFDFAWMNDGIPADLESIAALLSRPVSLMRTRWKRLGKCWAPHPTKPNRLVNGRQERERKSQAENSARRKAAADAANKARWSESDPNRTPNGPQSESDSVAPYPEPRTPNPIPTPDVQKNPADEPPVTKSKKPRSPASGPNADCIRHWESEWSRTRLGTTYVVETKDAVAVAAMLKKADAQEVRRRMTAMLERGDAWTIENASLTLLRSKWNSYAVALAPVSTGSNGGNVADLWRSQAGGS